MTKPIKDNSRPFGQIMIYLAWIVFLGLLTLAFNNFLDKQNNPNQQIVTSFDEQNMAEVKLLQNRQGHYVVTGKINQQEVTFLLDTGATQISIPGKIAKQLNLKPGMAAKTRTANGTITVYDTRLRSVSIGGIELHDIRASINPFMQGPEILLGMNFMKHLEIIQRDRQLTLRYYSNNRS